MAEKDEEVDEPEGESLANFITRLEALTDTERIRVFRKYIDKHGNIFLPVSAVYFVDTTGGVHEPVDTSGRVKVVSAAITSAAEAIKKANYKETTALTTLNVDFVVIPVRTRQA